MYSLKAFKSNLRGDLLGGLTAGVVALPLALGFGISSGAGAVAGLYGAIIIGFLAAVFGGTPSQISGPTGPMTVVMAALIVQVAAVSPENSLAIAFSCVVLGGLFQILFGYLGLGRYFILVSYPVISGFMTGIGVIIVLLQLGPFLGLPTTGNVMKAIMALPDQVQHLHAPSMALGIATLFIVFAWRGKLGQIIPSALLALIVITGFIELFYPGLEVARIGSIPTALPEFRVPVFSAPLFLVMLKGAIMLAVLGSIDSLLTSLVADNQTATQHDSDRELIGQGIGNTICGFFGGLPGAGATMRTVVNIRAGGRGPLSGVIHALLLLAMVAGLGSLLENVPLAVLSGILIKVGLDIIDWGFLKRFHRLRLFPAFLMILVLALTVFVDLIIAVFVGVFLQNLVTAARMAEYELDRVFISDGTKYAERLSWEEREELLKHNGTAVLFRVTGPISYAVGRSITKRFAKYRSKKYLVIDISEALIVGVSTALVLESIVQDVLSKGGEVKLIDADATERPEFQRLGLERLIGKENYLSCAVEGIRSFPI